MAEPSTKFPKRNHTAAPCVSLGIKKRSQDKKDSITERKDVRSRPVPGPMILRRVFRTSTSAAKKTGSTFSIATSTKSFQTIRSKAGLEDDGSPNWRFGFNAS